jgi:hypothetical protein
MIAGYDPDAVGRLERNAQIALAALCGVTSSDPAASGALDAVTRLRRALTGEMLPAVAAISSRNPLVHAFGWPERDLDGSVRLTIPRWESTVTRWSGMSNSELMDELRAMSPVERTHDRPFGELTQAEFDELVMEFSNRAAIDPKFAQMMIDELGTPLLGDIVLAGTFSGDVMIGVLSGLLSSAPSYAYEQLYRDEATVLLLDKILARPDLALDVMGDPHLLLEILTVNADRFEDLVPPEFFADLLLTGMVVAPQMYPERRDEAVRALANLVEVAQDYAFDQGFAAPVSQAMSIIIGVYIDDFIAAADHSCVINTVGDVDAPLGTRDEVIEFFGSLVHDPLSQTILAAVLTDTAGRATAAAYDEVVNDDDDFNSNQLAFGLFDVTAFSALINEAIDHENIELKEITDFTIGLVEFGFDIVDKVVAKGVKATGVGTLASFLIGFGVRKLEDVAVDSIDTKTTGAPDFVKVGELIIKFEIIKHAVHDRTALDSVPSPEEAETATALIDATTATFEDPASTFADIEQALTDLENDLKFILKNTIVGDRVVASQRNEHETNEASDACKNDYPN